MWKRLTKFQKVVLGLLILQFLPYLLLWDDAYIRIHDTLEGEWIWYHILFESGALFNFSKDAVVDQVMNGLTRQAYHTGLSFHVLWIGLFGLYGGYIFNYILTHLVAFAGMIFLLKTHFLKKEEQQNMVWGVALCFTWVPFYSAFGLTLAGQPLLLLAILNLLKGNKQWWNYGLLLAFPFYSSLVWIAPPLLIAMSLMWIYHVWKSAQLNFDFLVLIFGVLVSFLVVNWPLMQLTFLPGDFVSHREAYDYFYDKDLTLMTSLLDTLMVFTITHYHVGTMVSLPMLLAFVVARYHGRLTVNVNWVAGLIGFIALFFGFYHFLVYYFGDLISLLYTFKFDRVSILMPFLWCLLLALSLAQIQKRRRSAFLVVVFIGVQFLINVAANDEFQHNGRQLLGVPTKPNYKAFKAQKLFDQVHAYIGLPAETYRVVSVGLNPSVSQINDFYTLDGLQSVYDGSYKTAFRQIIGAEIEKDTFMRKYFDDWGNRCYIFSTELGWRDNAFMIGKDSKQVIENLTINTFQLFNMGGRFILSSLPIGNHLDLNLHFEKQFDHPESFWTIYLYRVYEAATDD